MDNKRESRKKGEFLIPDGWMDWWVTVNLEAKFMSKKRKLQQAGQARRTFDDRVLPNQALVGWRGWWSRMENQSTKDEKERKKVDAMNETTKRMQPIETYFKSLKSKIESGGKVMTGIFSSSRTMSSPKRKRLSTTSSMEPSPGKKRKHNFTENLSFWRKMEGWGTSTVSMGQQIPLCVLIIFKQNTQTNRTIWKWFLCETIPGKIWDYRDLF